MSFVPSQRTSLYVGDIPLDLQYPEDTLSSLFNSVAPVVSLRVCRDITTQKSLGYAYINFSNAADAEKALNLLNYTDIIPGRQIRIMFSMRDPMMRKSALNNVCITNLSPSINAKALHKLFSEFGSILSCKVALDKDGNSKGYGFVQFETPEGAKSALQMNGRRIGELDANVAPFMRKAERDAQREKTFTNVYANNIIKSATEEDVKKVFEKFGKVTSFFLSGEPRHSTKFALANFETHEDAVKAIEELNNETECEISDPEQPLMVCRALTKNERARAKPKFPAIYQSQGRNLYVKHLADDITQEELEKLFAPFGQIESCALMRDSNGIFRGFAFVCFNEKESALAAIRELNGKMLTQGKRPLYVSQAEQKDMRMRILQQRHSALKHQRPMPSPMGMYGQQQWPQQYPMGNSMYMNTNMGMPPFMHGPGMMRRPMPPMRPMPVQHNYLPPQAQPQMPLPTAPAPSAAAGAGVGVGAGVGAGTTGAGIDVNQLSMMSSEERKNFLGETLYSRIVEQVPQQAAKITGMLLEMGTTEILDVLSDNNALMAKVNEAVAVLRQHSGH
ncbi:unnamed protein product [Phytomonas sp. EM1]|nr:unnamed protein product [Phytomonas sp. EM1]|eukprot:CCW63474.1 unnamed protein product [Phytomonas sp. isolate EM1]